MTDISTPGPSAYRKVVAMTSTTYTRLLIRARTGGPEDDDRGPKVLEHVLGWTLVVLLAVLVTRAGLM
ncbi:SCO1431 family membrane protein [Streptomyces sp. c-19]|uniref:SCO1431 family membrane protein n=1 Tax=Streptomyces sp. c-19 TaxID=2789275 RepID=UPI00397EFE55